MEASCADEATISLNVQTVGGTSIPLSVPANCRVSDVRDGLRNALGLKSHQTFKLLLGARALDVHNTPIDALGIGEGAELSVAFLDELMITRHVYSHRTRLLVSTEVVRLTPDIPLRQQWAALVPRSGLLPNPYVEDRTEALQTFDLFGDQEVQAEAYEPEPPFITDATICFMATSGSAPRGWDEVASEGAISRNWLRQFAPEESGDLSRRMSRRCGFPPSVHVELASRVSSLPHRVHRLRKPAGVTQ
ncbi:unnamed protein product [Prorocentrum cordatum]|uniref:Ubiquitin-like domain-containing protein n=1 Tax=Prorocentrum cordatum TaxID=2364126 RepID=A0ABN9SWE8_9DINO|nr:unnamed protein product [Polarella glacialis]